MRDLHPCPPCGRQGRPGEGVPGRLEYERAAGERPPRARPQRRGSPGPIPNPAVKPAFAESTAARGCGRAGRRARGGRFSIGAERGPRGDAAPCGPLLRHGLPAPVSGIFGGCAFPFGRHRGGDAACAPKSRGGSSSAALFESKGGKIDSMVLAAQRRRRARSGNLPPCGPFLRYEVQRCLPDALLVLSEVVLI